MNDQSRPDADWISLHVFYAANSNPLLVDCVVPLVRELREQGLLRRWFFIKYWLEGPHVRLRLLPERAVDAARVRDAAQDALSAFLRRRPALYEADRDNSGDLFKQMFLAEYGEQRWNQEYGPAGFMPYRENNSVHQIPYEREYDRYGGPAGIELSEWHFEKSSEIVVKLFESANTHVRTVLLGQSVQLAMALCQVFLPDGPAIADFLENYRTFWEDSYQESSDDQHPMFDRRYARMAESLRERILVVHDSVHKAKRDTMTPLQREWQDHCVELRTRVVELAEAGTLTFRQGAVSDPHTALSILLTSYVHMTNNRLGVSILDEIYLSYINRRALLELTSSGVLG